MRICLVSQEYPPLTAHGGIGTQTWNKAQCLYALGHEVQVLSCAPGRGATDSGCEDRAGLRVYRMPPPGEAPGERLPLYDQSVYMLGYTWQVLGALERLAGECDFELINFPEYGAEGFAYQLNRGIHNWRPVIVQDHGPLAMFAEQVGWPATDSRFFETADFMEGRSLRMTDGLMASSANIADFVCRRYGVVRGTIDVVHCGVDCAMFRPCPQPRAGTWRPTVLFVGNVEAWKGALCVFEAVMALRSKYPDIRYRVVGKGNAVEELRRRAEAAGAGANVEFQGFVREREDLPHFYQEADVFASPAHHEVGVANVYVEALACGCPVVACNRGGEPEAVDDGASGLLVPPKNVAATAAAIDRLLGDPPLHRRMWQAARRRAESYFATDHYIRRVLDAYANTTDRSRRKIADLKARAGT